MQRILARSSGLALSAAALAFASYGPTSAQAEWHAGARLEPREVEHVSQTTVFEGCVLAPNGTPASRAVVVSSAGGRAVTGEHGEFRLEASVPLGATSVQITAVASTGTSLLASAAVALSPGVVRVGSLHLTSSGACEPGWLPQFGSPGGVNNVVRAFHVYDAGDGPMLYVGGAFSSAGEVQTVGIATWDSSGWAEVGDGTNDLVLALEVFDDGRGPALYAAGLFTAAGGFPANRVARWDGTSWETLGSGMNHDVVALAVYDDGAGPALYAGGDFTTAGGVPASRIARWDGTSWSALGSGVSDIVWALCVHDDGGGSALYAGGDFMTAGGAPANRIASWDGTGWSTLGSGTNDGVRALQVFDDGGGPDLYVGGNFTSAGGVNARRIARWQGATWSPLGSGMNSGVHALGVHDDGSGPELYAGGTFTTAGPAQASRIARWDGAHWFALGPGVGGYGNAAVFALGSYDDSHDSGSGSALFAGGLFRETTEDSRVENVARWRPSSWSPLQTGAHALNGGVNAVCVYDDGSGPALYAAGEFTSAGGVDALRIAKWDGTSWSAVGGGLESWAWSLCVYDDGGGPALYVGGFFESAGGVLANAIAKWDGSTWSSVGDGVSNTVGFPLYVETMAVYDDGSGPALFVGGSFDRAGTVSARHVAKWNGSAWQALGSGTDSIVRALAVHDDGNGARLFAGGEFTSAGGVSASRIAKWNGTSWAALGSGVSDGASSSSVQALAVFDDGGGPALYVGGDFSNAGGAGAVGIASWDGANWASIGDVSDDVTDLTVHDDGSGPGLFVAGTFLVAGGVAANRIARWDGSWSALGSGFLGGGGPMTTYDDGGGSALYASAYIAIDSGDGFLAMWGCDTVPPTIACPSPVLVLDRPGGAAGEVVEFSVAASDDHDPEPEVVCVPPSGSVFSPGKTLVECTATDASGNQATCRFLVTVVRGTRPPP